MHHGSPIVLSAAIACTLIVSLHAQQGAKAIQAGFQPKVEGHSSGEEQSIDPSISLAEFVQRVDFDPGEAYGPEARKYQGIPSIERTPEGRLWAAWYAGKRWEDKYNWVTLATSGDDGKTWSDLKLVIDPDGDGPLRTSDPCLWLDPTGRLWLFWWLNGVSYPGAAGESGALATGITMAITTENPDSESPTWSDPRLICTGVMLNKPTVTRSGEWILPVSCWGRDGSAQAVVSVDKGKTWSLKGAANIPADERNADETMIVERRDGSLWKLIRTNFGIHQSVSEDAGATWSEAERYLPHTVSRFFIRRLASGNLLLIRHGPPDQKTDRSHLTAYLSDDDGASWKGGLVLDERDFVSYPDATQAPDGTIYAIYDWKRWGDKHILMASFTEEDVMAAKFISPAARSRVLVNHATGLNPVMFPNGRPPAPVPLRRGPAAVIECLDAVPAFFETGVQLFSDRSHTGENIPAELQGLKFFRGTIEGVRAVCRQAGLVYVVTPARARNPDSLFAKLEKAGFEQTTIAEFPLFGASKDNLCSVYQRNVEAGETLDFGKWGLLLVPEGK